MKNNKRLILILGLAAVLMIIPLIAMQFTDEVNWTISDHVIAGFLLFGTGLMCEFVLRHIKRNKLRVFICISLLILLVIIWAELAVGILGSPIGGS